MADVTFTITCPNEDCQAEIDVEATVCPAESNWGADADGNRGIYVPAYIEECFTPEKCPTCEVEFDEEQQKEVDSVIKSKCDNWEPPTREDYDDYEPDEDDRPWHF